MEPFQLPNAVGIATSCRLETTDAVDAENRPGNHVPARSLVCPSSSAVQCNLKLS